MFFSTFVISRWIGIFIKNVLLFLDVAFWITVFWESSVMYFQIKVGSDVQNNFLLILNIVIPKVNCIHDLPYLCISLSFELPISTQKKCQQNKRIDTGLYSIYVHFSIFDTQFSNMARMFTWIMHRSILWWPKHILIILSMHFWSHGHCCILFKHGFVVNDDVKKTDSFRFKRIMLLN